MLASELETDILYCKYLRIGRSSEVVRVAAGNFLFPVLVKFSFCVLSIVIRVSGTDFVCRVFEIMSWGVVVCGKSEIKNVVVWLWVSCKHL